LLPDWAQRSGDSAPALAQGRASAPFCGVAGRPLLWNAVALPPPRL
jgi:hypothetical protein